MESQICQKCAKTHLQAEKVVNSRSGVIALWPCEAMMTVSYSVVTAISAVHVFFCFNKRGHYHCLQLSFAESILLFCENVSKTLSTRPTHKLMLMFRPTSSSVHQRANKAAPEFRLKCIRRISGLIQVWNNAQM